MKRTFYLYLISFSFIILFGCKHEELLIEDESYSFFVAGHTYGNPVNYQEGLYPAFVNQIPELNTQYDFEFGVFAGDFVPSPTQNYIDAALTDIAKFDHPIHIAAGNHDRGDLYLEYFKEYYYTFKKDRTQFIFLSPTDWNIEGDQLIFFKEVLNGLSTDVDYVFIIVHELIWWSPENKFGKIKINWIGNYPGSSNYEEEVKPLLTGLNQSIYFIAGDLGAGHTVSPYMYHKEDNITYIATGMGGGKEDNFLIIDFLDNKNFTFSLKGFNDQGIYDLAVLEDFKLPE